MAWDWSDSLGEYSAPQKSMVELPVSGSALITISLHICIIPEIKYCGVTGARRSWSHKRLGMQEECISAFTCTLSAKYKTRVPTSCKRWPMPMSRGNKKEARCEARTRDLEIPKIIIFKSHTLYRLSQPGMTVERNSLSRFDAVLYHTPAHIS